MTGHYTCNWCDAAIVARDVGGITRNHKGVRVHAYIDTAENTHLCPACICKAIVEGERETAEQDWERSF